MNILKTNIDGIDIYFEIDNKNYIQKMGPENPKNSENAFYIFLDLIETISKKIFERINKLDKKITPNEFELEFGININAEVGAVIAKSSAETQFNIKIKYIHNKRDSK